MSLFLCAVGAGEAPALQIDFYQEGELFPIAPRWWPMVVKPQRTADGDIAGNWRGSAVGWAKEIRHFPMGERLTAENLNHGDLVLSGWIGLGKPDLLTDSLIGVLLPGDRLGAVLDGSCCGVALTPVSLTSDEDDACAPVELRH